MEKLLKLCMYMLMCGHAEMKGTKVLTFGAGARALAIRMRDTYPLSNFIRPRCAERAKPSRGKPVLIMHIGFFACFHAISLERSRFSETATLFYL